MGETQKHARRQQRLEELCGAVVRALTGDADLHLRARGLYRGRRRIPFYAPHLRTDPENDCLAAYRGATDGMALRLRFSDPQLHRERCPQPPIQRLVFELLEQLRVESLVPEHLPGVEHNVVDRFVAWSRAFHHAGLSDSALGVLLYTLAQICWSRLNGRPVLEETADFIEATRAGIVPLIGHDLATLKSKRRDQAAYARAALSIARTTEGLIRVAAAGRQHDEPSSDHADEALAFELLLDYDEGGDEAIAGATTGRSKAFEDADGGYRVFTRAYDREIAAATIVRPALLRELRESLDERVRERGVNVARLARGLSALFGQPAREGWSFGEEEGQIDGRRLAQLVSSPAERRVFRQEGYPPTADTLVSLLIDCSGSMKQHIHAVAVLVDVLGRALQLAGVSSEVLGFTTAAWHGGRAQRDWLAQGRPMHPGRLNEVTYMVYKDVETSWRRARRAIAALLKPDLFREGVDGEAVDWACARMSARDERRRVLIVISDGCPMDTATSLANDPFYLDNHLQQVVARHERQGEIEVYGLGVGLDLSPFYSRCLALDLSQGPDNAVFGEILCLLRGDHRR